MFVYELKWFWVRVQLQSFKDFHVCFEQGVPWHSGNHRVWIHSETPRWHDMNIQSVSVLCFLAYLLLSSATSETTATSFLPWNCCLKQIHTLFIFFSLRKATVSKLLFETASARKNEVCLQVLLRKCCH